MKTSAHIKNRIAEARFIFLCVSIILILFLASCTDNTEEEEILPTPTAQFEASGTKITLGTAIQFSNQSLLANAYTWSFGDGETSDEDSPSHTYLSAGKFLVILTATSSGGQDMDSVLITVEAQPIVSCQKPAGYLKDIVFSKVTSSVHAYSNQSAYQTVEFFEAEGNDCSNRPLILLSPGGAWTEFSRMTELKNLCKDLAKRGYAVGLVKYRISAQTMDIWVKSANDQLTAVRYFKEHADEFMIDKENIFIGGWSTGGMLALVNALATADEIMNTQQQMLADGLSAAIKSNAMDTLSYGNQTNKVKGVLAMATFTFDLSFVDAGDAAIMLINHQEATLSDGTSEWGKFSSSGVFNYGIDLIRDRAIAEGYVEGANLEYIKMEGPLTMSQYGTVEAMSSVNFDRIATYFFNNLD